MKLYAASSFLVMALTTAALRSAVAGHAPFYVPGFDPASVRFNVTNVVMRAKESDARACYELGVMFMTGHQLPANKFLSYDCLRRSADLGYGYASLLLGMVAEFGGGFIEKGVASCESLPYRGLIAARRGGIPLGLELHDLKPREYYSMALSNGVECAKACIERADAATRDRERRFREENERRRRVLSGDCRNDEERQMYQRHIKEKADRERENERRRVEMEAKYKRDAEEKKENAIRHAEEYQKQQMARLSTAERCDDPQELYWAACFLRAWAATADDGTRTRRVDLARRSFSCLERAAAKSHGESEFRLGLMLWAGDTYVLGPDPKNRGGFLDTSGTRTWEWIPESVEVVKKGDVKGPSFAPYIHVRTTAESGTDIKRVLIYKQDIPRGITLIRKAAEDGCSAAASWLDDRRKNGFSDDTMPWEYDNASFDEETTEDTIVFNAIVRTNDYLGHVFRCFKYDRRTGKLISRSAEMPQRNPGSPWK